MDTPIYQNGKPCYSKQTCKTCKHFDRDLPWRDIPATYGTCKLMEGFAKDYSSNRIDLVCPSDEYVPICVGIDFGCIHYDT